MKTASIISIGNAKVKELDVAFRRDLDVAGLNVSVDDALVVKVVEYLGYLSS